MKKIVTMLVVVSLLLISCAHRGDWTINGQPLTLDRKARMERASIEAQKDMTVDRLLIERRPKEREWWEDFDLGPLGALLIPVLLGVMVWAFIYGFQKSMDNIYFNPGAIFP